MKNDPESWLTWRGNIVPIAEEQKSYWNKLLTYLPSVLMGMWDLWQIKGIGYMENPWFFQGKFKTWLHRQSSCRTKRTQRGRNAIAKIPQLLGINFHCAAVSWGLLPSAPNKSTSVFFSICAYLISVFLVHIKSVLLWNWCAVIDRGVFCKLKTLF